MEAGFDVTAGPLEMIAFRTKGQEFCVATTSIREIRGHTASTPIPQSPQEMLGVINLRGTVIPIIDLAQKLGLGSAESDSRSVIIVAEIRHLVIGLLVDEVSEIITARPEDIQPSPDLVTSFDRHHADGIISHDRRLICILSLPRMFRVDDFDAVAA